MPSLMNRLGFTDSQMAEMLGYLNDLFGEGIHHPEVLMDALRAEFDLSQMQAYNLLAYAFTY